MNCELKRMDPALETIKTSFLLNFRTGNVLLDTMINGLIIMAVGYVTTSMGAISRNFTLTKMREGFLWVLGYRKRSIFISGMITRTAEDNRPVFSTRFKAVLHKIKKLELAKAKITGLKEIKIASEQDLFVEQFRSFYFTPEVEGNILCFDDEKNGGKTGGSYTEENYIIEVFSWTSSLQELKELLEVWEKDYEESFVRQTITLTGKVVEMKTESSHFDFSDRMFAVMHKISTLDFHSSAHDLEELHLVARLSRKIRVCRTSCRGTSQGWFLASSSSTTRLTGRSSGRRTQETTTIGRTPSSTRSRSPQWS